MADGERLGASFAIDVTNLKAGLAQANRMIRESESEFKAAAAGLDDWTKSEDGLNKKIKSLNDIADLQKKKVDALTSEYESLIAEGLDPTSQQAIKLRTQINNETAALKKSEAEIKKQEKALDDLGDESKDTEKDTEKLGKSFDGLKKASKVAVGAIAAVGAACVGAVSGFLALGESTKETQTAMAKLDASFVSAFGDTTRASEIATDAIYDLYGVVGDMDRATEAANLLAKMSKTEEDVQKNTRILTGVFAQYGDSIPTEGLAEGMAATAEMAQVQGVLADALEWQGINLDDYNAKLQSMSSAEERSAYIQETLIGLYGESADAYREKNKALIESNEAQLRLEQELAELGKIALPIVTELKNMASKLLQTIKPFVELIGIGLKGALDGSADAADKLVDGLGGIINALLEKIVEMLPKILDFIIQLAPKIIETIISQIPKIIDVVIQIVPKIIETILSQIPMILQMIVDVITQIIESLTKMLPMIVNAIVEIIPQIITSFIEAIPQLLQAAVQFLSAIVEAIPTIITKLLDALPDIITAIINTLLEAIPILIEAAISMFMAIVEAIPVIIKSLIENLPKIIQTIIEGLIQAMPLILEGAIQMLMAIIQAIPTIIEALIESLPDIIDTIITTLIENAPALAEASLALFYGLITAIPMIIIELVKTIPKIIESIVNGIKKGFGKVKDVGGDLIRGLWEGISNMVGWIGEKLKGFGETILGGLKSFFGIESPSKLMANVVGKNIALGIGKGFEDNIGSVNDDITDAFDFDDPNNPIKVGGGRGVVVYQTNNYSQAHSRLELYKSKQATAAAVRLALGGV